MKYSLIKLLAASMITAIIAGLGWAAYIRIQDQSDNTQRSRDKYIAPVEAASIQHGPIELRRTFSGALEAVSKFMISPKIGGRIEKITVHFSDIVQKGQVVAELDSNEYVQAVSQAKADLAVAEANLMEAKNALEIADRELKRIKTLRERGALSESKYDLAKLDQLAKKARLEVTKAQVEKAEASLETARIRLDYTKVTADWTDGKESRIVAERFVDEGETVSANTPLLSIVELDPVVGVIFVTEKDYTRMQPGQSVSLKTDAYPKEVFHGRIERIAPVFRQSTRQARIEIHIDNPRYRLKPGMFIRATIILDRKEDATIVPLQAMTTRGEATGIFIVDEANLTAVWREVEVGIIDDDRVEISGDRLFGRVVTLGQQLIGDGSEITIPDNPDDSNPASEAK